MKTTEASPVLFRDLAGGTHKASMQTAKESLSETVQPILFQPRQSVKR